MKSLRGWYGKFRVGRLGRNAVLGTSGLGFRAVLQAAYLVLLSRWLGSQGYGLFAGSVALMVLAAPLANWGSGLLLTRYIARDRDRCPGMWATALIQTGITGGLLTIALMLVSAFALHERVGVGAMLLLALSELILLPAAQAATSACFALENGRAAAAAVCLVPLGRVLAILAMIVLGTAATPAAASIGHFAGSLAGMTGTVILVAILGGWPQWRRRLPFVDATRQGTAYAIGGLVGTSYLEVDKVLMLQLLGAAAVGPYTAGFRVVSVFALPISALISATLPRLMTQHAVPGDHNTYRAVVLAATGFGLLASIIVAVIAPWVPYVFGPGYAATTRYVLLLAPWPLLFALHQCVAANLTATDRQTSRVLIEGAGLLFVIVLNLTFLQPSGPKTSALTLLLAEVAMTLGCWAVAKHIRRRTGSHIGNG
jgi:O-antigen/teichoic acid export membrane protein